jgi:hypothetical protein
VLHKCSPLSVTSMNRKNALAGDGAHENHPLRSTAFQALMKFHEAPEPASACPLPRIEAGQGVCGDNDLRKDENWQRTQMVYRLAPSLACGG